MLYAILCYHDEKIVGSWTHEQDEAVLTKRNRVTDPLRAQGKLGPSARLTYTPEAVTVRMGREPLVTDGPFTETKEQLLGFYILEGASMDEAVDVARRLGQDESVTFEIRPVRLFKPGADIAPAAKVR